MRAKSHPELGFGFCKAKEGDKYVLSYIDVPDVAEHEFLVSAEDLIDAKIPDGTRVWIRGAPYGWQPGETRRQLVGNRYEVGLVNLGAPLPLHEDQFKVRWSRPLENPVEAISNGLVDAPIFYEARSALLSELVKQRSACRGLTGALSAPINLFQHQIDTAARVLADPVMRYLLADEVGLGKTIEAGIVIRQFLLDDPKARVLILCPEGLLRQWNSELRDRLGLHEALRSGHVRVTSHEVLRSSRSLHWLAAYDFIVIDEAHNTLPLIGSQSELEQWLRSVDCLLALSATPMRGDLETFHRLLALVDPIVFADMSFEAFRTQLQERERSAMDVQVLSARRASLRQKTPILDTIDADFSDDEVVKGLITACRSSDDPNSPEWSELADYLREVYRLSRRMIRHRRNSGVTDSYRVAGRDPTFVDVADPARPVIDDFLESYARNLDGVDSAATFALAVLHGLAGPVALMEFLQRPRSEEDRALFEMTSARIELVGTTSRLSVAANLVAERIDRGQLVVVASVFQSVLETFESVLAEVDGVASHRIHRHYCAMTADERDDATEDFLSEYGGGVLLADNSVEEGRNLQEAHVLINLDIPLDINQLEQRIGRLDRYAVRPEPAEVVIFTESNSDWVSSHIDLLRSGIGVFDTSVSTVQRLLTDVLDTIVRNLLLKGAGAFELNTRELRTELEDERDNIDLLEELEAVEAASIFTPDAFHDLIQYEQSAQPLRDAMRRLTTGTGALALKPVETADGVVTFGGTRGIGLAADDAFALEKLLQPKAYDRIAAVGSSGVMPFRIGDSLVDWLEDYLRADERGRASAFARPVAGLTHPALWLHCEFIVEFNSSLSTVPTGPVRRRLARRAEIHLQPIRLETWTDASGPAPADLVDKHLARPFDAQTDEVLRGRLWEPVLEELSAWVSLCQDSANAAWDQVNRSPVLNSAVDVAVESAEQDIRKRLSILEARKLRTSDTLERTSMQKELDRERQLATELLKGIRKPAIRLVACGACLLWPEERF